MFASKENYTLDLTKLIENLTLLAVVYWCSVICLLKDVNWWLFKLMHLLVKCIVLDNLWFSRLPMKAATSLCIPVSCWMCQCNANWEGRRTATCCLSADMRCPIDWMVHVKDANCFDGMQPGHVKMCGCLAKGIFAVSEVN